MKNVSILSKLFLVSVLAIPCGKAFGVKTEQKSKQKKGDLSTLTMKEYGDLSTLTMKEYIEKQALNAGKGLLKKAWESNYVQTPLYIGSGAVVGGTLVTGFCVLSGGLPEVWKRKFSVVGFSAIGGFCGYLVRRFKSLESKVDNGFDMTVENFGRFDKKMGKDHLVQKSLVAKLTQKIMKHLKDSGKTQEMVALLLLKEAGSIKLAVLQKFIKDNELENFVKDLNKKSKKKEQNPVPTYQAIIKTAERGAERDIKLNLNKKKRQQEKKSGWFGFSGSWWTLGL